MLISIFYAFLNVIWVSFSFYLYFLLLFLNSFFFKLNYIFLILRVSAIFTNMPTIGFFLISFFLCFLPFLFSFFSFFNFSFFSCVKLLFIHTCQFVENSYLRVWIFLFSILFMKCKQSHLVFINIWIVNHFIVRVIYRKLFCD